MKSLSKSEFLRGLQQQVEAHLSQAIEIYQNLDQQALLARPDNGGWNICECLVHLNTYSLYYLPKLEERISIGTKANPQSFSSSWLGNYFQKMMDPERGSKKYKAASNHLPTLAKACHEIVAEFIEHQERLCQMLERCQDLDLNAIRIPTSLSSLIRLNLGDTLAFLITHDERHIRQANRNLALLATSPA